VLVAEGEIREALTNLVFNALDAMPAGGTLGFATREGVNGEGLPSVMLEVSDSGIGMDEPTRRRCLEPFFTTKGDRGTGLGLAMVYGMLQRHGGSIEIDSAPGRGTTMRLVFPQAGAAGNGHSGWGELEPEPAAGTLQLLLVDDDPVLVRSLTDVLTAEGHVVASAGGGQQGIEAFTAAVARGQPFDAVITDLGMPNVDGRQVAQAVKLVQPGTPVVMLTGWGRRMNADGERPQHVDHLLSKPPRLAELRAVLAQCKQAF
jgi:CheY-like chemotaxis protein